MLMDRYGAKAIFDENSVLLADQSLNITEAVIAEIDARPAHARPGRRSAVAGASGRRDARARGRPAGADGMREDSEHGASRSTRRCRRRTSPGSSG